MSREKSNIVLIGMPGSGKSTVGVILAKIVGKRFLDTDLLIQYMEKKSLQDIIDESGPMALREVEERVLMGIRCRNHIIATGGSAAYSEPAMDHLTVNGTIVFLHATLSTLKSRIHNYETRGLAKRPDQSFRDLFDERLALYEKYADITIESSHLTQDQVSDAVADQLRETLENNYSSSPSLHIR